LDQSKRNHALDYISFSQPNLICDFRICEILGGKGAAKGSRFQAKVSTLKNREKVIQVLADHFKLVPN